MKHTIRAAVVAQFHRPRGLAGSLAGWVMAHRPSNRRRNAWAVDLLDVRPGEKALEVGFGPGLAVARLSRRVGPAGHVHGVDHSRVMLRQASRRNAAVIRAGRVTLTESSVERLPPGPFDAILAVNSLGMWPDPADRLRDLRHRLAPGGRIAIVSQPRCPGATGAVSLKAAQTIEALLTAAGFTGPRTHTLALDPPAVCVLAIKNGI
ncbi:class I SAM-dependent methyltransferase [Nonomuraea typhae]|uniref:Class I SAM-dependent methyltransferase n=1 Tax=Nonomuraea typhae TaxID=2603600 RepID=A0ABW7Z9M4_9ACTN